ncbi:MAG TPA: Hsp20 family protein [Acetobacteraceae bacterium]
MNALNLSPLFRTAIGFDRLARMADSVSATADVSYPPYNIERTGEDSYRLTMAVAGFSPDDIELTVKENTLLVSGRVSTEAPKTEMLYRGIAGRAFERRFVLADHITVEGATLEHGLLHVSLKRVVPEQLKPRRIEIGTGAPAQPSLAPAQANPAQANDDGEAAKAA